jgi:predicted RNase H-like HicB family nuclease
MHRFLIVLEEAAQNWAAYSPDSPGCVATGATREEAEANIHEALRFHVAGLREEGLEIPRGRSFAEFMVVE